MAETALTLQKLDLGLSGGTYDGLDSGAGGFYETIDETNGNKFRNNGRSFLHVKNPDASGHTITLKSQKVCSQGHQHDVTITVPASGERMMGGLLPTEFNDANKDVLISWGAGAQAAGVTAAAIELVEDGR